MTAIERFAWHAPGRNDGRGESPKGSARPPVRTILPHEPTPHHEPTPPHEPTPIRSDLRHGCRRHRPCRLPERRAAPDPLRGARSRRRSAPLPGIPADGVLRRNLRPGAGGGQGRLSEPPRGSLPRAARRLPERGQDDGSRARRDDPRPRVFRPPVRSRRRWIRPVRLLRPPLGRDQRAHAGVAFGPCLGAGVRDLAAARRAVCRHAARGRNAARRAPARTPW